VPTETSGDEYTRAGEIAVVEREPCVCRESRDSDQATSDARMPSTCADCGARLCRERSGCKFPTISSLEEETCQVVVSSFESQRDTNFRFGRYTPSHVYKSTVKFSSFEYRISSVIRGTCLLCRERPVLFSRTCTVLSPM